MRRVGQVVRIRMRSKLLVGLLVAVSAACGDRAGEGNPAHDAGSDAAPCSGPSCLHDAATDATADGVACPSDLVDAAGQPCTTPGQVCGTCPFHCVDCSVLVCLDGTWTSVSMGPDPTCFFDAGPDAGPDAGGDVEPDAGGDVGAPPVFPGALWSMRTPAEAGLSEAGLASFQGAVGGRGIVVRGGTVIVYWGDPGKRADIASAVKPFYGHFLFAAVAEGLLAGIDVPARDFEPRLDSLNAALGFKDRGILFRHLATQTSGYGVREPPGTAFDYNDWQMALFFDTLFLRVYGETYQTLDARVLHDRLFATLGCEDSPTFLAFGAGDRPGRMGISVRDHARFGLLYLREGSWNGQQLLPADVVRAIVASPLSNTLPRTAAVAAQMIAGQRSLGSQEVPDDQTDHLGSYSFLWWTNGVDRNGQRSWPDAPLDTYAAHGHWGRRALVVIPSLDLVVAWNDSGISNRAAFNHALGLLTAAAE